MCIYILKKICINKKHESGKIFVSINTFTDSVLCLKNYDTKQNLLKTHLIQQFTLFILLLLFCLIRKNTY